MWLWAWFTGGGWILVAGGVVVLGLVAAAVVVGATARRRDYPGRHVLAEVPQHPPGDPVAASDFYGSMGLEDERALYLPDQDAREQMLADLSPEALDEAYEWANYCTPHCPDDTCRAFGECAWRVETEDGWGWVDRCPTPSKPVSPLGLDGRWNRGPELHVQEGSNPSPSLDSGPGVVPSTFLAPGPDRLCGPEQPHEKPAGTESAGSGHLGPRAAWVLDCYRRRHQEKWAWTVTGWSLAA